MPLDDSRSYLFDIIMHFIHSFRMPLFFVLAGFFTSLLIGKRSFKGTYINRAQRILVPSLLAVVTILPLTRPACPPTSLASVTSGSSTIHSIFIC
ncbi:MAG: fucose 4-O-acetylase-like acetyltransferase [Candidatus Azotimanducaceae bacterium]|jgi:fucose 4-O-acetylase-like acetyltransferase